MLGIGCLGDIAVPNPSGEIYPFEEESKEATIATPRNPVGTVPIGRIVHR
jgi:hypothetical protein